MKNQESLYAGLSSPTFSLLPHLLGCLFVYALSFTFPPHTIRHMREIQALHSRQKEEIDCLFTKLGKVAAGVCDTLVCVLSEPQLTAHVSAAAQVPPAAVLPPVITLTGRRRRPTKSKSSKSSRTSSAHSSKSQLQPGERSRSLHWFFSCYPPGRGCLSFSILIRFI